MATETQVTRLRYSLGLDETSLPDEQAQEFYTMAGESYPSNAAAIEAYVRILILRQLKAKAVGLVDYTQNESQEKLGQIFSRFDELIKDYESDLDDALIAAGGSVIAILSLNKAPKKFVELPDDYVQNPGDVSRP